ncbi:MAG: hypothetical protein CSA58_06475 [Micrococcales bacterium]|nr:MAG: hypothetical protein CSB46_08710 [Micrococcales bacterium]PIE26996.1 MAG: hypothetical protein CSA58_06475 [Micrococcales bacterium]
MRDAVTRDGARAMSAQVLPARVDTDIDAYARQVDEADHRLVVRSARHQPCQVGTPAWRSRSVDDWARADDSKELLARKSWKASREASPTPRNIPESLRGRLWCSWPTAAGNISDHLNPLLRFSEYPAEYRIHLRTTNLGEWMHATMRLRQRIA